MGRLLVGLSILLGGLITLVGLGFIGMYVWGAVIERIAEPDQSLLFWYLPVLFLGVIATGGGAMLLAYGITQFKNRMPD